MNKLVGVGQLRVGTKLKIVGKHESDDYGSISVKKIIAMRHYGESNKVEPYDYEILINRSKNSYFSMNRYAEGISWVSDVFILDGIDKRLKEAKHD